MRQLIVEFRKTTHPTYSISRGRRLNVASALGFCPHLQGPRFNPQHFNSWFLDQLDPAHLCLFLLQRTKKVCMSPQILVNFYHCIIESILTNCISVWYVHLLCLQPESTAECGENCPTHVQYSLPTTEAVQQEQCLQRAHSILRDTSHPSHRLVTLLLPRSFA